MARGDYQPKTFVCIRCNKTRTLGGRSCPPVCVYCQDEMERSAKRTVINKYARRTRKGKVHNYTVMRKSHFAHDPKPDFRDIPLLIKLDPVTPALLKYRAVWDRQRGRCSRCLKYFDTMRVVPKASGRGIRNLVCPHCLRVKPTKKEKAAKPPVPKVLQIWKRADTLMRQMLLESPSFKRELQEALDRTKGSVL